MEGQGSHWPCHPREGPLERRPGYLPASSPLGRPAGVGPLGQTRVEGVAPSLRESCKMGARAERWGRAGGAGCARVKPGFRSCLAGGVACFRRANSSSNRKQDLTPGGPHRPRPHAAPGWQLASLLPGPLGTSVCHRP
jgi:hypothetical protein